MNRLNSVLLVFLLLAIYSSQVQSQVSIVDQGSELRATTSGWAISDRNAQTVTVAESGRLAEVGVQICQTDSRALGDLWVEIYDVTNDGRPDTSGQPLAAVLLRNSQIPLQRDVDGDEAVLTFANFLPSGLTFSAGDQFAIVLNRTNKSNPGTLPWMLWSTSPTDYARGAFYLDGIGGWNERTSDHGFQTVMAVTLGDIDGNSVVNFLDIAPFVSLLSNGEFQREADMDLNDVVDFLDIRPFILVLLGL